jgi:hypothetical protein
VPDLSASTGARNDETAALSIDGSKMHAAGRQAANIA